jgi:hypothetical protein
MGAQPEHLCGDIGPRDTKGKSKEQAGSLSSFYFRWGWYFFFLAVLSTFAGFQVARHPLRIGLGIDARLESSLAKWQVPGASLSASPVSSPAPPRPEDLKSELQELSRLSPQQQAERLLERAIHRQQGSLDLIGQNVDGWRGRLQSTDRLFDLVLEALNSDDLRVRSAAAEIDLAANNLSKSPESVRRLVQQIRNDPTERPWALRRLGALGNRGVEPKAVLAHLLAYARDRNEETRYWAVEGLAMLGSDDSIDPLLERFAHDPSPRVRERAACSLAQSGMLTKEQRLVAVPHLLNLLDDDSLDSATRGWVYGMLRLITGAPLGNDGGAWRKWWAHHDRAPEEPSHWTGILRA